MNWIKQNKFLSGFIGVMVIGVGALGYLLITAKSIHDEGRSDYETKVAELNRLENLKPYPEADNLKQFDAQKKEHAAAIDALHKTVAAAQIPVEPLTREQFQDKLREAVTRITTKAKESGTGLPAMFYLGMEKYQTEPPLPEAAPALGRQLKALEFVLTKIIEGGISSVTKFDRESLPEEEGKGKKDKEPAAKSGGVPKSAKGLVAYRSIQIELTSEQSRFRAFLNQMVTEKAQFFVPRLVVVKNEKDVAPPRAQPGQPPAPAASTEKENTDSKYTFGLEKVNVAMVLDMVDFAEVAAK